MKPLMKWSALLHTCEAIFFWLRLLMWDDIGAKWRRCHSSVLISDARLCWYEWRQGQRRQIGERISMIFFFVLSSCHAKTPLWSLHLFPFIGPPTPTHPLHTSSSAFMPSNWIVIGHEPSRWQTSRPCSYSWCKLPASLMTDTFN